MNTSDLISFNSTNNEGYRRKRGSDRKNSSNKIS